ncbi:Phage-related protein [Granulibacter bethesdensis]|uniref:Phage-related protein n=1 Tax=Granulibacter bethesdensis TaxID=364410 RepID=A0AAC9K7J1_9PROT|nr:Gp138 family membrane-puncturing spike protein [Granulibacter bethesdensis]APH54841.1 Phage-related protein [Granulibacter bethesdensis]APH62427.1 Phage-related protein [Granulibacter bethesdensis]
MSDNIKQILKNLIASHCDRINTTMPGTIVSYDTTTRRAVVQLSLSKTSPDAEIIKAPRIVDVPVVFPSVGTVGITWPLHPGDGVMLHFCQRSLENWKDAGSDIVDNFRQTNITDAIAVPGLAHSKATAPAHAENMVIAFGSASLELTPSGGIVLNAPGGFTIKGAVSGDQDAVFGGISVKTHAHTGVQPGSGRSGPPSAG